MGKTRTKLSEKANIEKRLGRGGGGQVVSVLAFYFDDLSSNPTEVYNFSVKLYLKRKEINKKRPGWSIFQETLKGDYFSKYSAFLLTIKSYKV